MNLATRKAATGKHKAIAAIPTMMFRYFLIYPNLLHKSVKCKFTVFLFGSGFYLSKFLAGALYLFVQLDPLLFRPSLYFPDSKPINYIHSLL
jgi:hypothetical protein